MSKKKAVRSLEQKPLRDDRIEQIVSQPYRHELRRNEDGTWFARVVELPGCMTEGDTEAEALDNLQDAMREWVRTQLEDGDPIPPPSAEARFSGKFVVRVAPSLHRELVERAACEGISLNALASMALAQVVTPSTPFPYAGASAGYSTVTASIAAATATASTACTYGGAPSVAFGLLSAFPAHVNNAVIFTLEGSKAAQVANGLLSPEWNGSGLIQSPTGPAVAGVGQPSNHIR